MEAIQNLLGRRSIRSYTNEQVPKELLEQVIECGKYAPSAGNQQRWKFIAIQSADVLAKLSDITGVALVRPADRVMCYGAPTLVLVAFPRDYGPATADGSCAMQTMFLAAHALGLGSCWISSFGDAKLTENADVIDYLESIGLPKEYKTMGAVSLGYPAAQAQAAPRAEDSVLYV